MSINAAVTPTIARARYEIIVNFVEQYSATATNTAPNSAMNTVKSITRRQIVETDEFGVT